MAEEQRENVSSFDCFGCDFSMSLVETADSVISPSGFLSFAL